AEAAPGRCGAAAADQLPLADPEGTPVAVLHITERTPVRGPAGRRPAGRAPAADGPAGRDLVRLAGRVVANRELEHGPFRRLMLTPAEARAKVGDGPVLAYATRAPLNRRQIRQLRHLSSQLRAQVLVLPLVGGPTEVVHSPQALVRTVLAAATSLPAGSLVVPVPLAPR